MARRDQVLSLFGASPAQILQQIRQEEQTRMAQMRSPEAKVGFGLGRAIGRAFGGEDPRVTQARQRQAIAQGIQAPMGTSGYFAEAAQRFQEQEMTQSALAAIQQAQILKQEEDKLAQAQAAKQAAVAYVSSEDPQLGSLVQSGALPPSEGIQAVRSQKAIKPISPDVYTQLVANHGHENASKYVQTRNLADLGPRLDPKVTEALSTWGQRLKDQGYIPGTPQFEEQMRIVNQKNIDAIGKSVTVNQMNSMEKKEFLAESITTDPRYDAVLEMESKLSKASSVMPNARRGERPAITLLQRTISDLYNSDTRAASEIDRLVNANKSITETVTDAGTQFIFGELTPNALTELQNILNNANMLINDTKTSIVNNKLSLYESEISDEAIRNTILKSYGGTVQVDPIDIRQYLPR